MPSKIAWRSFSSSVSSYIGLLLGLTELFRRALFIERLEYERLEASSSVLYPSKSFLP